MLNENTTHMTEDEARKTILDYQERTGKSWNAIGKELGFASGSAVSQFLSGTYLSPNTMIMKIEQFFKISEKREVAPKRPGFQMTSTSQQVTSLIEQCHVQGQLGVAYGDPGVGKTEGVLEYVRSNPDSIVITVDPDNATIAGVRELIAEALKINERVSRRITAEIVSKLKSSRRVIIVDEAQHLKAKVFDYLRCIVDKTVDKDTGEKIGMALVGNDKIYRELKERHAIDYAQVGDRVVRWAHVAANKVTLDDIKLIFGEENFDAESLGLLHKISTMVSIRQAVHVFTNTVTVFKITNYADITAAKLARVAKEMNITVSA